MASPPTHPIWQLKVALLMRAVFGAALLLPEDLAPLEPHQVSPLALKRRFIVKGKMGQQVITVPFGPSAGVELDELDELDDDDEAEGEGEEGEGEAPDGTMMARASSGP
eukprot:1940885-Prymnesium_polylepis.1